VAQNAARAEVTLDSGDWFGIIQESSKLIEIGADVAVAGLGDSQGLTVTGRDFAARACLNFLDPI